MKYSSRRRREQIKKKQRLDRFLIKVQAVAKIGESYHEGSIEVLPNEDTRIKEERRKEYSAGNRLQYGKSRMAHT